MFLQFVVHYTVYVLLKDVKESSSLERVFLHSFPFGQSSFLRRMLPNFDRSPRLVRSLAQALTGADLLNQRSCSGRRGRFLFTKFPLAQLAWGDEQRYTLASPPLEVASVTAKMFDTSLLGGRVVSLSTDSVLSVIRMSFSTIYRL